MFVKSSEDVLIPGYGEIHLVNMKAACTKVVHSFMTAKAMTLSLNKKLPFWSLIQRL